MAHDAVGHAATTARGRAAGHQYSQHVLAALAYVAQAGEPMLVLVPIALPNARRSRCRQHHALIICPSEADRPSLRDWRFREVRVSRPAYRAACYIQRTAICSDHIQCQPTMRRRSCFGLTKANDGLVQRAPMRWIEVGLFIEVLQLGFEMLVDQQERP